MATVSRTTPATQPKTTPRPVWRFIAGEWQAFATAAEADTAQYRAERDHDTHLAQQVCDASWRLAREL